MKVIILCGGQGTRIRELTDLIPKPMVDIGGKPIVWHIMNSYARFGFTDFVTAIERIFASSILTPCKFIKDRILLSLHQCMMKCWILL